MQPAPIHTVQMQVASPQPPRRSRYSCSVKSLGILQIILAGVSAVFGIASAVATYQGIANLGSSAWGGLVFYLPAGILGILSVTLSVNSRRGLAIACLVMSILSSIMAGTNLIMYGIDMVNFGPNGYYYGPTPVVLDSIVLIVSLTELVVSIVASVYCCYVMNEYQQTTTTYGHPTMYMYNQQPAAYPGPAVAPAPAMLVTNQATFATPPPS
ncbi:uncharacterized protein LOC110980807 isoform X2 [Acanthaster planci]|uniref:Uncharacterized protein LOC110980807 isoform X2 n=1 Tax=Acanthaster planci TaxID=133434 RepID=A0A8B7YQ04_ACAPL|nr:uncharacterized protein LOC110980807 isoform X2 [Acanthaster planci]